MENVTEILVRMVGPLILTAALGVFFLNNDQLGVMVSNVKAEYLDDSVYSQKSKEYTSDGIETINCDELRATIVNGTDYVVIVLDPSIMRKSVIVYEADSVKVSVYRYTATNPNGVKLEELTGIQHALEVVGSSGKFSVTPEYDLNNQVRRIVYRRV